MLAGYAKEVAKNICGTRGHNLVSLDTETAYDPTQKVFITKKLVLCSLCALTPDQIRDLRDRPAPIRKPAKTAEVASE